jgi:hypothetical protein
MDMNDDNTEKVLMAAAKAPDDAVMVSKKEYDHLKLSQRKLEALREEGVDNWEGYSQAMRRVFQEEDDGA